MLDNVFNFSSACKSKVTNRRALCPQASGVTVSDVCKTTYEEIKKDKKHRYVVFFIRDEKQIDVEVIGESTAKIVLLPLPAC